MVEFTITGHELWARMERAVEKVNERLRKTVKILETGKVPYAVVGGHAVRVWVAQVDNTQLVPPIASLIKWPSALRELKRLPVPWVSVIHRSAR